MEMWVGGGKHIGKVEMLNGVRKMTKAARKDLMFSCRVNEAKLCRGNASVFVPR
jgi:hypothetical protein